MSTTPSLYFADDSGAPVTAPGGNSRWGRAGKILQLAFAALATDALFVTIADGSGAWTCAARPAVNFPKVLPQLLDFACAAADRAVSAADFAGEQLPGISRFRALAAFRARSGTCAISLVAASLASKEWDAAARDSAQLLAEVLAAALEQAPGTLRSRPDDADEGSAAEVPTSRGATAGPPTSGAAATALHALLDATPDFIAHADRNGNLVYLNTAGRRMLGLQSAQPLSGLTLAACYPEAERGLLRGTTTGTEVWQGESALLSADGARIPVSQVVLFHWSVNGESTGISVIARDISEARRVEAALRASEARFRSLIDNANDVVYTHDMQGQIITFNAAGEQLLGYTSDELRNMNVSQIVAPSSTDVLQYRARERRDVGNRSRLTSELELLTKDGECVLVEISSSAIVVNGEMVGIQGIARDIRERRRLDEQLRQGQKLEAIGRLAGGVAHDFNNMLAVITGYSELVLAMVGEQSPAVAPVQQIKRAGDRAADLTRQLLAFSRKQILKPQVLNLEETAAAMERMLRRLIGENIALVRHPAPRLWPVTADPGQLEQVIVNLVINARDAMPQGGFLTLGLENALVTEADACRSSELTAGRYVVLTITDTGRGMDAQTRSRIFEPFFTTKEVGEGTGLGLATVYGIIQQSGGHIEVDSALGAGTTFRIYLPVSEEGAPPATEPDRQLGALGCRSETLLLVEDEPMVRELLRDVLRERGFDVLVATGAEQALRIAEEASGPISLLLSDVVLPGMSGPELADRMLRRCPDMKVLLMSGYTGEALARHGLSEAIVPFIQKPFSPLALVERLDELLGAPPCEAALG